MKILHTVAGFTSSGGGVTTCTYDLLSSLRSRGVNVDILSPAPIDGALAGNGESWIKTVDNDCVSPYGYSRKFKRVMKDSDYDIYHVNGLWMHVNHLTASTARKKSRPYVISPHGMLYPDALRRSYWKKWPLIKLWFGNDIMKADCVHATCGQEAENIRRFGYRGRIEIIPNPVVVPDFCDDILIDKESRVMEGPRRIGFLGRLHPRKGIDLLFNGMSMSSNRDCVELVIMGVGTPDYEAHLRRLAKDLGIGDRVKFAGFVGGRLKYEQLAGLSALFVPSDFENFGMIVPEALLMETPVMASLGTPWEELNANGCGWWVDRSPEKIAGIIDEVAAAPADKLRQMGQRGRKLVLEKYSAEKVAASMEALYRSLI